MVKVIPAQFVTFTLPGQMLVTVAESSGSGMLWKFMAASDVYTVVSGCVEVLGGVLLIFRRTVLLGALVSMVALIQVCVLNLAYGVPVVLVPLVMLAMALAVSAPWWRRLVDVMFREVDSARRVPVRLVADRRIRLGGTVIHLVGVLLIAGAIGATALRTHHEYTARNSAWDGVWAVTAFDGGGVPWAQVAIDDRPASTRLVLRRGPDLLKRDVTIDRTPPVLRAAGIVLAVEQNEPDTLCLAGSFDGQRVHVRLQRMPVLVRSGEFR
ncbi:hypothetical protein NDR87_20390 [Nocardia sp. CDC159]|uniref:DoxX-like protein n=1 Tax=Nocardia pulmonis TaxID=2951408 RepID=A0A9X2IZQ1_9NOCA|nr:MULTISPECIES: hypothetical protein [Nocardia]MCM6776305.1 hypothetical protein [Nocardia pulmonis]MCM6788729.1 hypothetical protein [Nocardia sp. CDC159]